MKIGYLQFAPLLLDAPATRARLADLLATTPAVELLVMPELANSGYRFPDRPTALAAGEVPAASPFVGLLTDWCRQHSAHVVTGFHEREGDVLFNSALLIGPGGVLGVYRKLHLFLNEKDIFAPGNLGLPVFDLGGVKIGMLVCFDWVFPEVWRSLALDGADIICHPSNLVLPGFAQRAVPIHALINRVFTITANRIGTEGELTFTGLSTIADPLGNVLVQGPQADVDVQVVEIDLAKARNKQITPRNDVFADRRPDQYMRLQRP
jgi:predicted amidohydrolase